MNPPPGKGSREPEKPPATHNRDRVPPGCPLSRREFVLLRQIAFGHVSPGSANTERHQTNTMRRRLGVASNAEAVRVASERGWLRWVEDDDITITPVMREYLAAFDAHLMDRLRGSRERMTAALEQMHRDAA